MGERRKFLPGRQAVCPLRWTGPLSFCRRSYRVPRCRQHEFCRPKKVFCSPKGRIDPSRTVREIRAVVSGESGTPIFRVVPARVWRFPLHAGGYATCHRNGRNSRSFFLCFSTPHESIHHWDEVSGHGPVGANLELGSIQKCRVQDPVVGGAQEDSGTFAKLGNHSIDGSGSTECRKPRVMWSVHLQGASPSRFGTGRARSRCVPARKRAGTRNAKSRA